MTTLQEAARVTILPETMEKARRPLRRAKRNKLRTARILEYIQRRPFGEALDYNDLNRVVDPMLKRSTLNQTVRRMEQDGIIVRHELSPRKSWYSVNGPVTVTQPAAPKPQDSPAAEEIADAVEAENRSNLNDQDILSQLESQMEAVDLEQKAMRFAWNHLEDGNDLRKFISWLKDN